MKQQQSQKIKQKVQAISRQARPKKNPTEYKSKKQKKIIIQNTLLSGFAVAAEMDTNAG